MKPASTPFCHGGNDRGAMSYKEDLDYVRKLLPQIHQLTIAEMDNLTSVTAWTERRRSRFMEQSKWDPPKVLRMIDCKQTLENQKVMLVDWSEECYSGQSYTAVSHTFGVEVYEVFDCACTSELIIQGPNSSKVPPRPNSSICPGHTASEDGDNPYTRVVKDILYMCHLLWQAGSQYVWHDGVCIAQHDSQEVEETIKHIGWIYSNAKDTVIFLHYIGSPMAPISSDPIRPVSRWHSRVWTIQEAAVSQRRCYCIRLGHLEVFRTCNSFEDLDKHLKTWYEETTSEVVVIEEAEFRILVISLAELLARLLNEYCSKAEDGITPPPSDKACMWIICITSLLGRLRMACTLFPTLGTALEMCSLSDSKHQGDRLNSIAALAGLKNFFASKDGDLELSTIDFFRQQGEAGLATALFMVNLQEIPSTWKHSWVPDLTSPVGFSDLRRPEACLHVPILMTEEGSRIFENTTNSDLEDIQLSVLADGNLELTGFWGLVNMHFNWYGTNCIMPRRVNIFMDVYEEASIYVAFESSFHTTDRIFGWMAAPKMFFLEDQSKAAILAFPASKVVNYVASLDKTSFGKAECIFEGPRAIILSPMQDVANTFKRAAQFFISPHLRSFLSTKSGSIEILNRLVIS